MNDNAIKLIHSMVAEDNISKRSKMAEELLDILGGNEKKGSELWEIQIPNFLQKV